MREKDKDKKMILVVDDNQDTLDILRITLEGSGYLVQTCADGEAALRTASRYRPALILLDLMLPKIDGVEVCRRLRKEPPLDRVPVIFITAKSDREAREGIRAGEADGYALKPFDPIQILERIEKLLERQSP